jgi:hypothetical protein
MAKRNNTLKPVVVKEHPVQSVAEAGVYDLTLANGDRVVALANTLFPNHDEGTVELILNYIERKRPAAVILLGHIVDEDTFRSLADMEENYLHRLTDSKEFGEAMAQDGFEDKVLTLARSCGDFIKRFAQFGSTVYYVPSWTNLGLPNELAIMDYVHMKKRYLDSWTANHPEASDVPSDPTVSLPKEIDALFGIDGLDNIQTLPYGAAIKLNGRTMFLVGSFRRRHAGDSAIEEWAQRGFNIVKSVDGKSASAWWTDTESTVPHVIYNHHQAHELGYLWDKTRNCHLGDYNRRAQSAGFFTVWYDELFGEVVPVIRGDNDCRSMYIEGEAYTEETPGAMVKSGTLKLAGSGETSTGLTQNAVRSPRRGSSTSRKR